MPNSPLLRLLAVLVSLCITAAACSSDSEIDSVTGDIEASGSNSEGEESDIDPLTDSPDIDPEAPVMPESVESLANSLTGVTVTDEQLDCMVANADGDTQLGAVYNGFDQPGFQLSPEGFTALTVNIHDCMNSIELAVSLIALSGGVGDTGAFTTCVDGRLANETTGDLAYTGLAALLVQFPVPEGAQEITIEAASECIDSESLTNQLSAAREQASGFADAVDRECVADGLSDDFVESFWRGAITASATSDDLEPLLAGCTTEYDSGLAQELPVDFTPFQGDGALAAVDPSVRDGLYTEPPETILEDGVDYQALFSTADGEILIDLYEETAPITVNNFVALARDGYYDQTNFHRVIDGFMAQAGDPTNTGGGGPGYSFADEESGLTPVDRRGLLAMANSGPDTNGSQFFITLDAATWLDGLHTVFGEVVEGDDVLGQIDLRDPAAPTTRGESIISVEIIEG